MKTKQLKFIAVLTVAGATFLSSCQKEEAMEVTGDDGNTAASQFYGPTSQDADAATFHKHGPMAGQPPAHFNDCATITETFPDGEPYPKVVTIDFRNGECTTPKGHVKQGKIVITLTGDFKEEGSVRTVTHDGFSIDGRSISGTRTSKNEGLNSEGYLVISFSDNVEREMPDGKTKKMSMEGVRVWINGFETEEMDDDRFLVTGSGNGTGKRGTITRTILQPLLFDMSCKHITSGTVETEFNNGKSTLLSFGDGTCDNMGTMIRNGKSEEVNLDEIGRKGKKRGGKRKGLK